MVHSLSSVSDRDIRGRIDWGHMHIIPSETKHQKPLDNTSARCHRGRWSAMSIVWKSNFAKAHKAH